MVSLRAAWLSGAFVLASLATVEGQELHPAPSSYFDCPYVNYFDGDCPQLRKLWEEEERRRMQRPQVPSVAPSDQRPVPRRYQGKEAGDNSEEPDADMYLLFPKESLAPDAPPLFRLLLAEPTLDNARRYVRWYARRTTRLQAVQALIRIAGGELETEANHSGEVR